MIAWAVAALVGAVELEEQSGVAPELAAAIHHRVELRVPPESRVSLRILGIPGLVRVLIEPALGAPHQADFPPAEVLAAIEPWLERWFGEAQATRERPQGEPVVRAEELRPTRPITSPAAVLVTDPEPSAAQPLPWVLLGASLTSAALGVVFGIENLRAVEEGRAATDPNRIEELQGRTFRTGLAANILFGVAVVGAGAGVALLLSE